MGLLTTVITWVSGFLIAFLGSLGLVLYHAAIFNPRPKEKQFPSIGNSRWAKKAPRPSVKAPPLDFVLVKEDVLNINAPTVEVKHSTRGKSKVYDSMVDASPPLKHGWLFIQGRHSWSKRFFVAYPGTLLYYKSDKAASQLHGCICLSGCIVDVNSCSRYKRIEIKHSAGQKLFRAYGPNDDPIHHRFVGSPTKVCLRGSDMQGWLETLVTAAKAEAEGGAVSCDTEQLEHLEEASDEEEEPFPRTSSLANMDPKSETILKEGPLYVQGHCEESAQLKFTKRYCKQVNAQLFIYESEKHAHDEELLGIVSLEKCNLWLGLPAQNPANTASDKKRVMLDRRYAFQIEHPGRERIFVKEHPCLMGSKQENHLIVLRTSSQQDLEAWVGSLKQAAQSRSSSKRRNFDDPILPWWKKFPILDPSVGFEQVDWMNVILKRAYQEMRADPLFMQALTTMLTKSLSKMDKPAVIGDVNLDEILLGQNMVQVHSVRMVPTSHPNELVGELHLSYSGMGGVRLKTEFVINKPWKRFLVIPLVGQVQIREANAILQFHAPPEVGGRFFIFSEQLPEVEFDLKLWAGKKQWLLSKYGIIRKFLISFLRETLRKKIVYPSRVTFHPPFPGRKLDVKPESYNSHYRRSATGTNREHPFSYEDDEAKAKQFAIARFMDEVINKAQYNVITEIFTDDVVVYGAGPVVQKEIGRQAVHNFVKELHTGFPDGMIAIRDICTELGQRVHTLGGLAAYFSRGVDCAFVFRGTHSGTFWGRQGNSEKLILEGYFCFQFDEELNVFEVSISWKNSALFAVL